MTLRHFILLLLLSFISAASTAQVYLNGTIFNISKTIPLEGVSVMTTSGRGTVTDFNGHYRIEVEEGDSIYFSYLNKPTMKYPVKSLNILNHFDLALHIPVTELKEVRVMPRNYKMDSLQNRSDYAKIFNYQKPGLKITTPSVGAAVGLDLDELINVFRFKRNKSMLSFQRRLVMEEQDKFINHRFTPPLVRRLTQLPPKELEEFMLLYRPGYEFTKLATDYEFGMYILQSFRQYKASSKPSFFKSPQ